MTAIDFSTGTSLPAVGGAPATRLRLTVRGRRVLAFLASIPAVIALSVAIVSGGGVFASGEGSALAGTFAEVTVMPGDTLWSIAAAHLGAGASDAEIAAEWPRWYAANADLIGPDPNVIRPGQVLVPPTGGSR